MFKAAATYPAPCRAFDSEYRNRKEQAAHSTVYGPMGEYPCAGRLQFGEPPMRAAIAGVFGGVTAGLGMSLAMSLGRRAGVLHKTLAEHAEDWLDRAADTRSHIGQSGTWTLEQGNHIAATTSQHPRRSDSATV